jgi:hypothetical protein
MGVVNKFWQKYGIVDNPWNLYCERLFNHIKRIMTYFKGKEHYIIYQLTLLQYA